jgi:hypothetical protein
VRMSLRTKGCSRSHAVRRFQNALEIILNSSSPHRHGGGSFASHQERLATAPAVCQDQSRHLPVIADRCHQRAAAAGFAECQDACDDLLH